MSDERVPQRLQRSQQGMFGRGPMGNIGMPVQKAKNFKGTLFRPLGGHPVQHLLEITGDWQKFKGLPGTEGTLKAQPEKVDKQARFQAALAAAGEEPTTEATTPKKKSDRRAKGEAEPSTEASEES